MSPSISESELDPELVSITSPVCSPVISTKLYGLESEKDKTAFEFARAKNSLLPSLLNAMSFGLLANPLKLNAPLNVAVDKLKPVLRSYSKILSLL